MIRKYSSLRKAEAVEPLPPQVAEAFVAVGNEQRGLPEEAMLKIQEYAGGGVLSVVVEHAGDLIHRMTHMCKWNGMGKGKTGYQYVYDKVDKVLQYLTQPYGFEKEMNETLTSNAKYLKKDPVEFKATVDKLLKEYAREHSKLKVYNLAQWKARQACITIGLKAFKIAAGHLMDLQEHLKTQDDWYAFSTQYELNPDGSVKEFIK